MESELQAINRSTYLFMVARDYINGKATIEELRETYQRLYEEKETA